MQYIVGDVPSTIRILERSLNLLDKNDTKRICGVKSNIAQFYIISGSIIKAECLLGDIAKSSNNSINQFYINYITRLSTIYGLKGEYQKSKIFISKALPYLHDKTYERVVYHEYLGWIFNLEGSFSDALVELRKGLTIANSNSPNSTLISQIKRRMADSYLGLKDYNQAEKYATEALAIAEKLNERVEIAECWRIQAEIANNRGESENAKGLFKQAIDMFNMIGTKYNLAACRYIAATSGLSHNGERQALLYLAREYFESEDVSHYIKKIDDALSEPTSRVANKKKASSSTSIVIAASPRMKKIVEMADMIAPSPMSILLTGDTGTGKDHLAKYIHDVSGMTGEFVSINISAIPNDMIEAELFGHRKGAFTGADIDRTGLIEQAEDGTLFLNEIADASPPMQAKLLEAIENQTFRRLGENKIRKVSFRLLTATNKDLEEQVKSNHFRADLYHRIKQVPIHLPELSKRKADITALVAFFLTEQGVTAEKSEVDAIASACKLRNWTGNVRELKAELEMLCALHHNDALKIATSLSNKHSTEEEHLRELLEKHAWNRSEVARELGISEATVRKRIKNQQLVPNSHGTNKTS